MTSWTNLSTNLLQEFNRYSVGLDVVLQKLLTELLKAWECEVRWEFSRTESGVVIPVTQDCEVIVTRRRTCR